MFVGYEQIATTDVVKTAADLTIPATAIGAWIQAATVDARYTMDDATDPAQTLGMIFKAQTAAFAGDTVKVFLLEDLLRIRFCRGAAGNGVLNIHYYGGRGG